MAKNSGNNKLRKNNSKDNHFRGRSDLVAICCNSLEMAREMKRARLHHFFRSLDVPCYFERVANRKLQPTSERILTTYRTETAEEVGGEVVFGVAALNQHLLDLVVK